MRIKDEFRAKDVETARAIVRAHPFATIVTAGLRATHMPCLLDEAADGLAVLGTSRARTRRASSSTAGC